jgi:cell division protein FtsZ
MKEDTMNFDIPANGSSIIKVLGVGGGGSNAVNHMCRQGIKDVDFIVCNTDAQALASSPVLLKIQIGESLTEGRGAGNKPEIGKQAAIENLDDVMKGLGNNCKMVFITAGMGGGTGTGAAPVIAKATKETGILTVAIITLPFRFEGKKRMDQATAGLEELAQHVDSLLVINNEKLREIYGNLKLSEAFSQADNVLTAAAKGIAEIITVPGYINVDFADVQTIMVNSGVALMGSAVSEGEGRALNAIKEALNSPLLNNNDISGADNILLNITSGEEEVCMDEVTEITEYVGQVVKKDALIIWGTGTDPNLGSLISVTIIATGFEANIIPELLVKQKPAKEKVIMGKDIPLSHKKEQNNKTEKEDQFIKQGSLDFEYKREEKQKQTNTIEEETEKKGNEIEETRKLANLDDEKIEKLENQPAYKRKNMQIDELKYSANKQVSKYTLFRDENNNVKLSSDNSYLHDNVD